MFRLKTYRLKTRHLKFFIRGFDMVLINSTYSIQKHTHSSGDADGYRI